MKIPLVALTLMAAFGVSATAQDFSQEENNRSEVYVPAKAVVYNGSGVNPTSFTNYYGPWVDEDWLTRVKGAKPRLSMIFASWSGTAPPGIFSGGPLGLAQGELLCLPPFVVLDYSKTGQHRVAIPDDLSLIGTQFVAQAAILGASSPLSRTKPLAQVGAEYQNALILTIGGGYLCHECSG
jgi:hypothetical protein